jgi:hypothetical protein
MRMKADMSIRRSVLGMTAGAVLLFAAGCGSKQEPAGSESATPEQPAASEATQPAETPQAAVEAAGEKAQATVTAAVEQATSTVATQATAAVTGATNEVPALIEKAKGMVSNQQYQEALTVVNQLSNLKLTPEQQQLVDGLKTQIQSALAKTSASGAASALGNALGGKK